MTQPIASYEVSTRDADQTRAFGEDLGRILAAGDLLMLSGGLGAGKTTLTQGIGVGMGVRGRVASPTFIVARVHPSLSGGPDLIHADAYRITDLNDLETLDLDSSLDVIARQGLDLLAPDTRVYAIADARRRELYWGSYVAAGPDDVTLEGRLEVGDVSALLGAMRTAPGLVVAGAPIPAHSADALARADLGPQVSLDPAVMSRIVATRMSRGEQDRLHTDPLYLRRPDIQGQPTARL